MSLLESSDVADADELDFCLTLPQLEAELVRIQNAQIGSSSIFSAADSFFQARPLSSKFENLVWLKILIIYKKLFYTKTFLHKNKLFLWCFPHPVLLLIDARTESILKIIISLSTVPLLPESLVHIRHKSFGCSQTIHSFGRSLQESRGEFYLSGDPQDLRPSGDPVWKTRWHCE